MAPIPVNADIAFVLNGTLGDGKDNDQDGATDEDNTAPVADAESFEVAEDGALTVAAATLLEGDTDADGDALAVSSVSNAVNGTVSLDDKGDADASNDEVIFTPTPGYSGAANFDYTVSDGFGGEDTVTVNVTVTTAPTPGGNIVGGGGDGILQGDSGDNKIIGGAGNDLINGGPGDDILSGGADADTFQFFENSGQDIIRGYEQGIDSIDARGALGVQTHDEVFAFFDTDGNGMVTGADANSFYQRGRLTLEFDGDGVDGNAPDSVTLQGIWELEMADFDFLLQSFPQPDAVLP